MTRAATYPVRVFAYHKPRGVIISRTPEGGSTTVFELLPETYRAWYAVGRLDKDSEGLMLFCDSSGFAQRLMDPGAVSKTYIVTVTGYPAEEELAFIRHGGLVIAGRASRPADVVRIGKAPRGATRYRIILHEGMNRQIRRLFHAAGYKVRNLRRVAIGPLGLGDMPPGLGREINAQELLALNRLVSAPAPDSSPNPSRNIRTSKRNTVQGQASSRNRRRIPS
jgi:23S rRNA pseudouridine2605 synthase